MKIFRTIGILCVILLFVSAYLPWVFIDAGDFHQATLTGMKETSNFGKPALLGLIFSVLYLLTIFIQKTWVKMAGVFFGVVVISWSVRNYLLFKCAYTYCPDRKIGIYLTIIAAAGIFIASLLPYFPDKYRTDYE